MTFPLGPIHPALPEPISLKLALHGEKITGVETHTGYLKRSVETLMLQKNLADALILAERICGTCGYSHRYALCLAIESLAGITPPPRAQALRVVFAEVERILARLWTLAHIGRAAELGALYTGSLEAREVLFEACADAADKRLFWEIAVPGGVQNIQDPQAIIDAIQALQSVLAPFDRLLSPKGALVNRANSVGIVTQDAAEEMCMSGPGARAAGVMRDVRRDAPYDIYAQMADILSTDPITGFIAGSAPARAYQMLMDIQESMRIITAIFDELPDGQERAALPDILPPEKTAVTIEGARGAETLTLELNANRGTNADLTMPGFIKSIAFATPSGENIGALPVILQETLLSDALIALSSLDLCIACVDK